MTALIIVSATGPTSPITAGIVGIILGGYGLVISRQNSNNSGVTFKILLSSQGVPMVWGNY